MLSNFIIKRLLGTEVAQTGFTMLATLVLFTLFIGGVQLIGIGVVGEYLGPICDEVKEWPLYVCDASRGDHDPTR